MTHLTISPAGIAHIKKWEGLRLKAYLCTGGVWTIGYGATGPEIREGLIWTRQQVDERFARDIAAFSRGVAALLKVEPAQREFDVMVSLAFNIGLKAFADSTLLKKFNAGDQAGAGLQLPRWNISAGKVDRGLVNRRAAELAMWQAGEVGDEPAPARAEVAATPVLKSESVIAASAAGALTVAQQTVAQVEDIWTGLSGLGINPHVLYGALGVLAVAALGVVVYRAVVRRRG